MRETMCRAEGAAAAAERREVCIRCQAQLVHRTWKVAFATSALLMTLVVLGGCQEIREEQSRAAVAKLLNASASGTAAALEQLARIGPYAIPDIEQQLHEADRDQQLLLIEALRRFSTNEARPLLLFWSRWADHGEVRDAAARAVGRREGAPSDLSTARNIGS